MGGAIIQCGKFEGNDKAGSPIVSVLNESFSRQFGRRPRGRLARKLAQIFGHRAVGPAELAEMAILDVQYNEVAAVPPDVVRQLLPSLRDYQTHLLQQLGIDDDVDQIRQRMASGNRAKYGAKRDPGWHLYCLHDLVRACELSASEQIPVRVVW